MAVDAAKKVLRREIEELAELLPNRMPGGTEGEPLEPLANAAEVFNRLQDVRARLDHCPDLLAELERQADSIYDRTKPGSEFAALCLEVQSCLPQKVNLTLSTGLAGINDLSRVSTSEFLNAIESLRSVGHDANGYRGFQSTDELRVIEQRVKNLREDKRLSELTALMPSLVEQLDRLRDAAKVIWSDPELTDIEVVSLLLDCRNPEAELRAMLHAPLLAGVAAYRLSRMLDNLLELSDESVSADGKSVGAEQPLPSGEADVVAEQTQTQTSDDDLPQEAAILALAQAKCQPAEVKAWLIEQYAIRKSGEFDNLPLTFEWLEEHFDPFANDVPDDLRGYELPNRSTWSRQLRSVRKATGTSVNRKRAGRPHGKSIVKSAEI